VSLADTSLVGDGLLCHARFSHLSHPCNQLIAEFGLPVVLVGDPSTTTTLVAIPDVVGMRAVFEVVGIDASSDIAPVATHVRHVTVGYEERLPMGQYSPLVPAGLSISRPMEEALPDPTSVLVDFASALEPLHVHWFDVHAANTTTWNG
jgi:hypothetical protein